MAISAKVSTNPVVKATVQNTSVSKTVGVQNSSKTQDSFSIDASQISVSLDNSTATNVRDALNNTAVAGATQTFTNKTINADNNTISNLEVDNLKGATLVVESEGIGSNDNDTTLPTSAAVKDYVDTQVTAQDLDFQGDSGGALNIDLDSEALDIAGGTGIDTVGSANTVTVAIDSSVTTLTGSQSLTNKTLTSPVLNTGVSGSAVLDSDTMSGVSPTKLASSESIKAYVDTTATGIDTLDEMSDTNLTSPTNGALLRYDDASSKWIDDNDINGGTFV
jgi:hypothetical protein